MGVYIPSSMDSKHIYSDSIYNHFFPMINKYKMRQKYNYCDGYNKYYKTS
uniref:Uncharacterized protein n=1 Tax=Siphoviridae sp. ct4Ap70 TaxID=2825328 RepID=A0A8S5NWC0_9CAUD|nr:MAG TPA: hypothetical protein [Siphoviridae sp. ct4Ap70]